MPKPQFWYPSLRFGSQQRMPKHLFSWFSGYPQLTLVFSAGRRKFSDIFLSCLSRKSGSQHQLRIKPSRHQFSQLVSASMTTLMSSRLSGSHRSTRIASDLASRALPSQGKPQRESESQAVRIARSYLREAKPGGSKPGCFPLFSGKVQIVSRTLLGLFLVGALNRPRKKKRTNRENPRRAPSKSGKSQKNRESPKKDKKGRTSPDRETPLFETPPLAALDKQHADFSHRRPTSQDFRRRFFWHFPVTSDQANGLSHRLRKKKLHR